MSSHLTNIPEAVRIAGSIDPSIDRDLKQQALEYMRKVTELSNETWQVSCSAARVT
jgi:exportin-T